jgi:Holliday junction resolvase-like predicted endonuclease
MGNHSKRHTGDTGEVVALNYLQNKGYIIIETNYSIF